MVGNVGSRHAVTEFDPSSVSGKRWLEKMANKDVTPGTRRQHVSNNAPRDISDLDPEKRKAGIVVAKKWLDGAATFGAESIRVNSGGPRIVPSTVATPALSEERRNRRVPEKLH